MEKILETTIILIQEAITLTCWTLASLPSKKKRAPAPPSLSRGHAAPGGSGPMLHSSLRHGSLPNFQPDRIEYIKSMQSSGSHHQSQVLEDSESTTSNEEAWRGATGDVNNTIHQPQTFSTNRNITDSDISVALDELQIPDDIGSSLVRLVKTESDLGSVKSRQLLRSVLSHLGSQIPILDRLVDKIRVVLVQVQHVNYEVPGVKTKCT